ncbi:MAG TPA: hypothetical protein DD670_09330 [Planctomycetaceae bacterium]|nr:hypothetical protein [Planctomycetaceae bacterium]
MAIDIRKLRPSELCKLLNSTTLGEVIGERQLHRHRIRAGYRIGDGRHVDLFRYVAWLVELRHQPQRPSRDDSYEALKERARARNAALSLAGRDIGELPPVENPERKERASRDFRFFCEAYFPAAFTLSWSPDHLKVIAKIERAVLTGGLFAHAMPRGSGKTTLTTVACVWAILYGACPFVCLIAAAAERARSLLSNIKTWFETNETLLADFPEVVFPIRKLGRITNRQLGQTYRGEPTRIEWNADKIVLPTIPGSAASGAVMSTSGMKGSEIRGQNHALADGTILRPRLAIIDDPQTTESAWSLTQSRQREAILGSDILGMAGPGEKIAAILCCTVIRPGDMADNILDRTKHPQWQGERTKMIYAFPTNESLWARYAEIRAESFRNEGDGHEATEFYCQNQEAMDLGATVAWPERHNEDELSAIQHAMNLKFRDEAAFFAEYQNEPILEEVGDGDLLTADQVAAKVNRLGQSEMPIGCNYLTMFIDVQQALLFYVVAGWEDDFTGCVLDYGTYPDQRRSYFTLRDARHTLTLAAPGTGLEGAIYAGLESLTGDLLGREWPRDDGAAMRIERCLVDANWGNSTDVVYQFCRQSPHSAMLLPSHGRFVGASSIPFHEYKRKQGDRVGHNWRIPNVQGRRAVRHVLFDTNYWKSFVHARLGVAMGDRGCLSLFGDDPATHRLFAEHVTAEYRVKTQGRGRAVDEWKLRPEVTENHWLDCLVGCAVAASIQGVVLPGTDVKAAPRRARIRLSDLQRGRK